MNTWTITMALAVAIAGTAHAAPACTGSSPAHTVALVELYTSEGCDSCPPADKFFSGLRGSGVAPEQAVLLSLHVDYWNYIGWKDIYSRAVFTERQRKLADLVGSRTIYTPEMFIAARELRSDHWQGGVQESVKRINATPARADIAISLGTPGPAGLPVEVRASALANGKLHVALVQNGIDSQVKSGENRGRLLHHDHVVREWLAPVALEGKAAKPAAMVNRTVPLPAGALPKDLAVSAFVQSERGEILQAFSLPLCTN
jgi:hypothetical protein